jgi:biotin/methionine sulfoxide reductase
MTVVTGTHWGRFEATAKDGRIESVRASSLDPEPSPIVEAVPSAVHHRCRIRRPAVRAGFLERGPAAGGQGRGVEPYVELSWDEAAALVAGELERVRAAYGNEAIFASSGWASAGSLHESRPVMARFFSMFGGFVDQVTNYSFGAASVIVPRIVGSMAPVIGPHDSWPSIARNTELMVSFGGMAPKNGQVNQGGTGRHEVREALRRARGAGVDFVSISPSRDDFAAELGAEWLPIRPNTDTALMLGLAHTLLDGGMHDAAFLDRCCVGFERFAAYLRGATDGTAKDADWAARITEIDAAHIRELAARMAGRRTLINASWSVQRTDHGEQAYWAVISLAAMLGQIGKPGGGFGFGYGAIAGIGMPRHRVPQPKLPVGDNPVARTIPTARFTDMLLDPGAEYDFNGRRQSYPDVKLMYWCGGNPFHKQQDLNRLLRAWQVPETIVVHEPWWNATARRADIVLPATTPMERNDIGASAFDRFYLAQKQVIPPVGEARNDFDIFADLAGRLGFGEAFTEGRTELDWLRQLYDVARQQAARQGHEMPSFDRFWEDGVLEFEPPVDAPVPFAAFADDPDAHPLKTPSGKIELYSDTIAGFGYADCPGHATWMEPAEWLGAALAATYPLHLLSNQPRSRLHSQMDCGSVSAASKVGGREPVRLNAEDARARGIADGDIVRIFNARGACLAGAIVTDGLRPGVVELSTGAWFDPEDAARIGSDDKHGNPNVLTRDKGASSLTQTCTAHTTLVEVERWGRTAPPVGAHEPPAFVAQGARMA